MIVRGEVWEIAREAGVLTERQLLVLELRELHGLTWNQIAYKTDADQSTVRGHYRRAQRRLVLEIESRQT
jgi:DNA-binding NarL/FixJ family response regulator